LKIKALKLRESPYEIRKAPSTREWMDQTREKNAYRCLPLTIANSSGWEVILSEDVIVTWDGGVMPSNCKVTKGEQHCVSHFGEGVITFHTNYLFLEFVVLFPF
jgi:hypothetical protein